LSSGETNGEPQVRIETIVPRDTAESILQYLQREVVPKNRITACRESVEALREEAF
jgi:hypothetical protein